VRIVELPSGRIQFQVKTKEVFTAHGNARGDTREREVAERAGSTTREYSLDAIGMARSNGQLTEEGKALIAMLRGAGRLKRRGDDVHLLRLSEHLKQWTGLEDDPFQFTAAGGVWVARFECESRRPR
jgi:hypothetical protein